MTPALQRRLEALGFPAGEVNPEAWAVARVEEADGALTDISRQLDGKDSTSNHPVAQAVAKALAQEQAQGQRVLAELEEARRATAKRARKNAGRAEEERRKDADREWAAHERVRR